jgi:hypothetical protein
MRLAPPSLADSTVCEKNTLKSVLALFYAFPQEAGFAAW